MAKISVFKMAPGKNDLPFDPYVQLSLSHISTGFYRQNPVESSASVRYGNQ